MSNPLSLALYQPDIPQNTGTLLRLCACLDIKCFIIEPCGFPVSDYHFRRAGMDYLDRVNLKRFANFSEFQQWRMHEKMGPARLILLSTKGKIPYTDFNFQPGDILMVGRESAGVPDDVFEIADAVITIKMQPKFRSLNVAMAGAMIVGEALRQLEPKV